MGDPPLIKRAYVYLGEVVLQENITVKERKNLPSTFGIL